MSKIMKSTNTMNNVMNKLNKNNNSMEVNTMKTNKYQENNIIAVQGRIENGTATLKDLTAVKKNQVIDFAKCTRKINMIQRIYSGGSAVGACTIVAGNMYTVELTEENMHVFKDAISNKILKEREEHTPYGESVWTEGYNMFSEFRFETGQYYVYYVVTNEEMKMLKAKIAGMDYNRVTLEDLQALQADLPPFVRAWQESSIDVSKDKEKVFNMNYDDFFKKIDVVSTFLKQHMEEITMNLTEAKDMHKAGKTNFNFKIELPLNEDVLPDMLGKVNVALKDATEEFFNNQLAPLYGMANREYYKQFANDCKQYPELALYIYQVYSFVKQSFGDEAGLNKEQYALLRNSIYTKAVECGVEDLTQVVRIAISVAMRNVKLVGKDIVIGEANVDHYKPFLVQRIFEQEYEVLRTNQPMVKELTLVYVADGVSIAEGEEVEFAAGFSTDDTVEVEELFTGIAYNKEGKLVYEVNVYEYEETKSAVTVETFEEGTTTAELKTDKGEFAAKYFEEYDVITVAGKNANILANGKMLVAKVAPSVALKGNHNIQEVLSFETTENRARVFFIVLA